MTLEGWFACKVPIVSPSAVGVVLLIAVGGCASTVYAVRVEAPAINEVVMTTAESPEQARERATASALQRQLKEGSAEVVRFPGWAVQERQ